MGPLIIIAVIVVVALAIVIPNICIVQQGRAYVIEFLGAYRTTWQMGLHVKVPFVERIARKVSLKEQVADFPPQPVISCTDGYRRCSGPSAPFSRREWPRQNRKSCRRAGSPRRQSSDTPSAPQ